MIHITIKEFMMDFCNDYEDWSEAWYYQTQLEQQQLEENKDDKNDRL